MLKRLKDKVKWTSYEIISKLSKTARIKIGDELVLKLGTKNAHEMHRAATFYTKEPEMIEWLNQLSLSNKEKNFVFYDIGANIGIYSLYTAILHKTSTVYSFEPESTNFSSLCENIVNNDIKNIIPLQLAYSDIQKFDLLNVGIVKAGAGAASIEGEYMNMPNQLLQGVYCISLDSIYENPFFKKPNFIKIDVDGHESVILENAGKILADNNLKGLMIEYAYSGTIEMDSFISKICSYGFKLTLKSNWIDEDKTNNLKIRNFLFERDY